VLENFDVGALLSSLPDRHPLLGAAPAPQRCAAGAAWSWDGVRFAILHPGTADARSRKSNDLSCVLKVSAGGRSMLLTGDIERRSEQELLERGASALRSDVLLVPHHGSRTSSSAEFLAAAGARAAVIPVGYRNRFGHPSADVLARLRMPLWRTDRDGAVTVRLPAMEVLGERQRSRRYWHDAPS
jgi:competence protein ComEC